MSDVDLGEFLSLRQAAEYVGRSRRWLRMHLYQTHRLKPDARLARMLLFRRETLDEFLSGLERPDDCYLVADAAEYLGLSKPGVMYHITASKRLVPDAKGPIRFKKETLDRFRDASVLNI